MCREAEIGHAWPSGVAYDPLRNPFIVTLAADDAAHSQASGLRVD